MSMETINTIFWAVAIIMIYFAPAINSKLRKHNNQNPILLTNLFFGWTGIGWIIALIWSTSGNVQK